MKNLFSFATKELSQDAFLSWFIANCNDESIGEYSYSFINKLTGLKLDFFEQDIKEIKVTQQKHNMDIIVDFWTDLSDENKAKSHYVLVIEDKTTSDAHSGQLKKYADEVAKWNTNEKEFEKRRFKVFYKTNHLSEKDKNEISKADENRLENDKWIVFDIDKIWDFFSKINKTKSEILNSYIEHINTIHKDLIEISIKPMNEWDFINFQTYFDKIIKTDFNNHGFEYHFETWTYQGRLVSLAFYYHSRNKDINVNVTKDNPCFAYPILNFVYRKHSNVLIVYTHVTFHWVDLNKNVGEEHWNWKYSKYEPDVEKAKNYIEAMKAVLNKLDIKKVRSMKNERDQTISTDEIQLKGNNDEMKTKILEKIVNYFKAFKEVDENFKYLQ